MNLKKFISGVSALTIAASAFAGMTITASAETTSFDWTRSHTSNKWSETATSSSTVIYSTGTGSIEYDISDITANAEAVVFEFDMKVPSASANKGRFIFGIVDEDIKKYQNGLTTGSWFGSGHSGNNTYYNVMGTNRNDYGADAHYVIGIDVVNKKVNYTITSNTDTTKVFRSGTVNPHTSNVDSVDKISFYSWSAMDEANATTVSNMTITTYDLPSYPSYTAPTTTAESVYTGLAGGADWIANSPTFAIDTDKGAGYNFYARADFCLAESGSVTIQFVPENALGTVITLTQGEGLSKYNEGSDHTIDCTLEADTWYTFKATADMANSFAEKTKNNNFSIDIINSETKASVLNTAVTGVYFRNQTNKAVNAVKFTTDRTSYLANAYAYYAQDYTATVASGIENGTVTVNGGDSATAVAGEDTVTVAATPADSNYRLGTITVTGNETNNTYALDANNKFTMPKENVTVSATFVQIPAGQVLSSFTSAGSITGTNIADAEGINITVSTTSTEYDYARIQPISYYNNSKAIAFTFADHSTVSNSHAGSFEILNGNGDAFGWKIDYWSKWRIRGITGNSGPQINTGNKVVLIPSTTENKLIVYIDGKRSGDNPNYAYSYNDYEVGRTISGFRVKAENNDTAFGVTLNNFRVIDMPAAYDVTGGGVEGNYLSGTTVTLAGSPESGFWYDGSDYYKVGDTYTVADNVTFEDKAPVTAALDSISDVYEFTKGTGDAVTGAVLHVTVSNGSAKIAVKYNDGDPKTTTGAVSGSAVIGVIVNGTDLNLAKSNFTVDAVAVE